MDFIDFYERALPSARVRKAFTPWDGPEGQRAREKGVRTADEFTVLQAVKAECAVSGKASSAISDGEIARRLKASPDGVSTIVQNLTLRGVLRAETGVLGSRMLVPCA